MLDKNLKYQIQEMLKPLKNYFSFYRALVQDISGLSIAATPKQTTADPLPHTCGIVITAVKDGIFYEAATPLLDKKSIAKLITGLIHSSQKYRLPGTTLELLPEEELEQDYQGNLGQDFPLAEKIRRARDIVEQLHKADPSIATTSVRFKRTLIQEMYISEKRLLSQTLSRFEAFFSIILHNPTHNNSTSIFDGFALQGGWENMTAPTNMLSKMVANGKKILHAKRIPPGTYDCIFTPSLAGILAHEAFGHGTEADTMAKGRARGSAYLGKQVAADVVKLYDNPALAGAAASYFFDHEGQLASETHIVENGLLHEPMTDHRSASLLNLRRSPNGRRESYERKVYTRMTNTYFMPGNHSLAEMIASIEDGFLVDRATNGMEDPKSWGIQLEALYAERIKKGKLTGEVYSPVIVTGYVPELLSSISMISQELQINGLGMCGKGHKEWVKVTDGGPHLKLRARLA